MASGYLALIALCCCIKGVSPAAFAMVRKNNTLNLILRAENQYSWLPVKPVFILLHKPSCD